MTGGVGHLGRERSRSCLAVLAAGSLLAGLGLSACGTSTASAPTVLRAVRAATLVLAGGASRPATEGMTVPKGATVRTDPGGSASLVTVGRSVLLGSATAVTVLDGEREELTAGLVLIDARRSPGLSLAAGAATVTASRGALARVERGALLRAVSYRRTLTVRPTGRRAGVPVPPLHQRQVPDGGLAGPPTPLALTRGDLWERSYVLDLVTADDDLTALAAGLDRNPASSSAVLKAVPASYVGAAAGPPGAPEAPSETALAFVIARAAPSGDFPTVRQNRKDGGSWGVVAALARADVAAVSAALDAVLSPTEGPAVVAAGGGPGLTGPAGTVRPRSPQSSGPTVTSSPRPAPGASPSGRPSPRPSPSSDPVQQVVTTVTSLLPSATPTPLSLLPSPAPLVSVRVGGTTVGLG